MEKVGGVERVQIWAERERERERETARENEREREERERTRARARVRESERERHAVKSLVCAQRAGFGCNDLGCRV